MNSSDFPQKIPNDHSGYRQPEQPSQPSQPEQPHQPRQIPTEPNTKSQTGRPPQTNFNEKFANDLDYPRLGTVSFRRGTLTENQNALWQAHWPKLGLPLSDHPIDIDSWFGRTGAKTIVEIGSGTGTSTAAMAPLEADTNIIAVELYKPGLAKLMGAVVRGGIGNIRMIQGDGVEVLTRMFEAESLDGVRIFFPDPWPKARHHKRRIIQSGVLNLIATRLKPGGVLHVATDHAEYAEWISDLTNTEPLLEYMGFPWPECPQLVDRQVITKFEGKGLNKAHTISEFLWRRRV